MTFSKALERIKRGGNVSRRGWNGKGMYLELIVADGTDAYVIPRDDSSARYQNCLLPWIGIRTADGKFVPWVASQTDLLAEDWE